MGFCSACLSQSRFASRMRATQAPSTFPTVYTYSRITFGSYRSLLKPRSAAFYSFRQPAFFRRQQKLYPAAAWAGETQTAASSNFDDEAQVQGNSTFKQLCHSQLKLVCTVLDPTGRVCGTKVTLYKREPATFVAGQLQLSKVTSYTDQDSHHLPDDLDDKLFLGLVGSSAEKALAEAQLVDLPNSGAFVLPLAAHGFLVGLLVLEQAVCPSEQASNTMQAGRIAAGRTGLDGESSSVLLGGKDRQVVRLAGQVLAAACAMDLHSALQSAQTSMHRQQVIGLVEEVRGPLTALRTLGSILVPRLRQKEGQEIDRDVAQGILTQGDRLQEVVSQLQAAIHPAALPPGLDSFRQTAVGKVSTSERAPKRLRNKRKAAQSLLPRVKQDSSADDQLHQQA